MGTTAEPERDPNHPAGGITLDEMDAKNAEKNTAADLTATLPDDKVPEHLKGKTLDEIIKHIAGSEDSLKTSEAARKEALDRLALAGGGGGSPTNAQEPNQTLPGDAVPVEEPELTPEQLQELYDKDPMAAMVAMNDSAQKKANANMERRIASLVEGSIGTAESAAKVRHVDEFELFGDQIDAILKTQGINREALTTAKAWDDLVAYVRGQPQNFDKLFAARVKKAGGSTVVNQENAQEIQILSSGATDLGGGQMGDPVKTTGKLDAIELEIAEKMDMTPEEYLKWK